MVLGLILTLLPIWTRPWLLELAAWVVVGAGVPLVLLLIGLVVQANVVAGAVLMLLFLAYLVYWLPVSHRVVDVEFDAVISAPPASVFALVTDLAAKPRLHPTMLSAVSVDGGPLRSGSRIKARIRPSKLEAESLVTVFDPPRAYAERLLSGAPEVVGSFYFHRWPRAPSCTFARTRCFPFRTRS